MLVVLAVVAVLVVAGVLGLRVFVVGGLTAGGLVAEIRLEELVMIEVVDISDEPTRPVVGVPAAPGSRSEDVSTIGLNDSGIDRVVPTVVVIFARPAEPMVEELEIGAATSPPNLAPSRNPAAADKTAATISTVAPVARRALR